MKCPACGEREQIQTHDLDGIDPGRDRIRCRSCGTAATRYWWARLEQKIESFESLVNEKINAEIERSGKPSDNHHS